MATVNIGISHNHHLMVTELAEIHMLLTAFIFLSDSHAQSSIDILDFL